MSSTFSRAFAFCPMEKFSLSIQPIESKPELIAINHLITHVPYTYTCKLIWRLWLLVHHYMCKLTVYKDCDSWCTVRDRKTVFGLWLPPGGWYDVSQFRKETSSREASWWTALILLYVDVVWLLKMIWDKTDKSPISYLSIQHNFILLYPFSCLLSDSVRLVLNSCAMFLL